MPKHTTNPITKNILVENYAPHTESLNIFSADASWEISVWKDEFDKVHIMISDNLPTPPEKREIILGSS